MGFISDFLGGKKSPAPPPEFLENAQGAQDTARAMAKIYAELLPQLEELASEYPEYADSFRSFATRAQNEITGLAEQDSELYDSYGAPIQKETFREALEAGSPERQSLEELRAGESASRGITELLSAERARERRAGLSPTSGTGALASIAAGGAVGAARNAARINERNYGEDVRRSIFGSARQVGQDAINRYGAAADAAGTIADSFPREADALSGIRGAANPLGQQSLDARLTATDLFGTSHNANIQKHNADEARRGKIFSSIGDIAGKAFGLFGGSSPFSGGGGLFSAKTKGNLGLDGVYTPDGKGVFRDSVNSGAPGFRG